MGKNKRRRKKQNIAIGCACGIVILLIALGVFLKNSQKTNTESPSEQVISTNDEGIPESLIVFNKCRILKMVDDYNEIKSDRSERENFKLYYVVDDKTTLCLEERSNNVADFVNATNSSWEIRKGESFLGNNSSQTPEYFLERINAQCENYLTISESRDYDLKNFALYYAYWGQLGARTNPSIENFMSYEHARDLIFEADATYVSDDNGFTLSITLPNSGQKIVVNQDTDKDSGETPREYGRWGRGWWENVPWIVEKK